MMTKQQRSLFFFVASFLIALLLTCQQEAFGAKHGHGKNKQSLLEECQGASALPSIQCGRVPSFAQDKKGKVYAVFSQNGHIYLTSTDDQGDTYSPPLAINRSPEAIYDDGENRPKILLGTQGEILVSWTHKTPGRYSGDVRFSRSLDSGKSFSEPITINHDRALIGHRFDTMAIDGQGRLYVFWIDKRDKKLAREERRDYLGASIYFSYSDDMGKTFHHDKKWVDHSCECCRLAIAKDKNGELALLWRHVYSGSIRDHAIAYIKDWGAIKKQEPARVAVDNWMIEGCPHQGPDMSFDQQNRAHVVWFTQGEKHKGLMYGRYNFDQNKSEYLNSIDARPGASRPQVMVRGDRVDLLWKRFNGNSVDLMLRSSYDLGVSWKSEKIISNTNFDSDHPDLFISNGRLYGMWHTQAEGLRWLEIE